MKKSIIVVILTTLLLIALSGCQNTEADTLTIGVMADMGAVPFLIAKEQNFYDQEKLNVDIKVFRSALDRDIALQTGAIDGAMADMLTIFFYQQSGYDVKMTSATYGDYIMVSAPDMTKEEFLNTDNIQIGLSSNTVIDFATEQIAASLDIKNKLNKIAIPQMPVRLQLLDSGELVGATLPDPLAAAANLKGSRMGSTSELDLYPGIFIMNNSILSEKPKAIEKFYAAYNEAVNYLNSTELETYFPLLEEQIGFPESLKNTYIMPEYRQASIPDKATFDITQNWMQEMNLIENTYDYDQMSNLSFINR